MSTIKDVARVAGVSVTTVSRVFNNRGYLSNEVKQKVADAMREINYHANDLARALHNQESHIIGLIIPSVRNPYFGEVTHYVEKFAYERGYKVLLCDSLQETEKDREYIAMLRRSQVDGIIMGSHVAETSDYESIALPLISLDRQLGPAIPYICCDNAHGGELAARHLIEKGCRRVLHFCDGLDLPLIANRRTERFLAACGEAGIQHKRYELPSSSLIFFRQEDFILKALMENPDCDGIFASNDITATAVISAAISLGRRVPQDLKVIGFDGIALPTLMSPSLSTIEQPIEEIARYAVDYLIKQIQGETVPTQTILPVTLKAAGSTA
jgi:LacI family sucrose operon transcriptional repressor